MRQIDGYELTVIVDTREKKSGVIKYLEDNNIKYVVEKLAVGDYSLYLKKAGEVGSTHLGNRFAIERKSSVDEIVQNVVRKEYRARFEAELEHSASLSCRLELFIEDTNWYTKVLNHNYFSATPVKVVRQYLAYYQQKYNFSIVGIEKQSSGAYVLDRLIYFAKDYIAKQKGKWICSKKEN